MAKSEISDDPQADKENNMPTPVSRKSFISKQSGSKHKRRNIKNSYEKSIKESNNEEENQKHL